MNVTHATFTLEREFPVPPAAVFAAYADPAARRQWFAGDAPDHFLDFRVGGTERVSAPGETGMLTFTADFRDIVADQRILYSSQLTAGDQLSTVTATAIEFEPTADGTRLVITEHGMFLPGQEKPEWRQQGTAQQLDALAKLIN